MRIIGKNRKWCTQIAAVASWGFLAGMLLWLTTGADVVRAARTGEAAHAALNEKLRSAKITMPFVENRGQVDSAVKYYAQTFGGVVYVTTDGAIVYALPKNDPAANERRSRTAVALLESPPAAIMGGVALRETFVGGQLQPITGADPAETKANFFVGQDEKQWRRNVPTFNEVRLGEVYDRIELSLRAYGHNVEKIFTVHPGAEVGAIRLKLDGAERLRVAKNGELELQTSAGVVRFTKPVAYQEGNGQRTAVEVAYVMGDGEYGFCVGPYDENRPLVIDPLLASTYLGGSDSESPAALVIDAQGNVIVAGTTYSANFPTTAGGYDPTFNGGSDIFLSKLDSTLQLLLTSTFLGGSGADFAHDMAMDAHGNIVVAGLAGSHNYPTTAGAYSPTHNGGFFDAVISKLNSDLTLLLGSTYVGGNGDDSINCLNIGSDGNLCIAGWTRSTNFPVTAGAFDTTYNGVVDMFVVKMDATLTAVLAGTYVGGNGDDFAMRLTPDSQNNIWFVGDSQSADFPIPSSAYQPVMHGRDDVVVGKLNNTLSALLAATFLGGSDGEESSGGIAVMGNTVVIAGDTTSWSFPVTAGTYDGSFNGDRDIFVSKMDPSLQSLLASTFIGGLSDDSAVSMKPYKSGSILVVGSSSSPNYPTTPDAMEPAHSGNRRVIVATLLRSNLTALVASTYLGGTSPCQPGAVALNDLGQVWIAGRADSANFPVTPNAYDPSFNGGGSDTVVVKIDKYLSSPGSVYLAPRERDGKQEAFSQGSMSLKKETCYEE